MRRISCLVWIFLFASVPVHAASYLEGYNGVRNMQIWIDDDFARVKVTMQNNKSTPGAEPPAEMLLDIKKRKMYLIDPKSRSLLQMDQSPAQAQLRSRTPQAKISIERKGPGPNVAGFSTQGYLFSANGRVCSTIYTSKDALRYKQVVAYYQAMMAISSQHGQTNNPCNAVNAAIDNLDIQQYGLPISMLDRDGKHKFEIKKLSQGQTPPENYLVIPAGYKKRSQQQLKQNMQQHR